MKRRVENYLSHWLGRPDRKPLIVRGARQVGKTWLVRELARTQGRRLVEVNLELHPQVQKVFQSKDVGRILRELSFLGFELEDPHRDILFLDEIQECPGAIAALRYFYELRPEIAVVASGSLLEFALEAENFSMPVGRVEFAWVYPMSYTEFLMARGRQALAEAIENFVGAAEEWSALAHEEALKELRTYLFCGGMPQPMEMMVEHGDAQACRRAHYSILQSYRQDFYKYARKVSGALAEKLFARTPGLVGGRLKFSHIDPDARASVVRPAVEALEKAGVLRRVFHTSGQGLPLATDCNERIAKLFFLDVGLMHASLQIERELVQTPDLLAVHRGAVAEQFVAQELLASSHPGRESELYFWARDALNSQAEVDFLVAAQGHVLPVEVKAGASGTLKSLRLYLDSHPQCKRAVRLYSGMPQKEGVLWHLPIYLAQAVR